MPPSVCVLMALHNGERYVEEQIRSILAQQGVRVELLVLDDGSTDAGPALVARLAAETVGIRLLDGPADRAGPQGPQATFGALCREAVAGGHGYFAFADQDDVWHPEKLVRLLERLRRLEAGGGTASVPTAIPQAALAFCDLEVVDAGLEPRHPSFQRLLGFAGMDRPWGLPRLLLRNCVPGCALLFNRPLLEALLPWPREIYMHDWWTALCAAAIGRIDYLDQPLVRYRQHGGNAVGAKGLGEILRSGPLAYLRRELERFDRLFTQAEALAGRLEALGRADGPEHLHLRRFCALRQGGRRRAVRDALRYRLLAQSPFYNASFLLKLLLAGGGR
jgi:hypothetical protein